MKNKRTLIPNLANSIYSGKYYFLLLLSVFAFACSSATTNETADQQDESPSQEIYVAEKPNDNSFTNETIEQLEISSVEIDLKDWSDDYSSIENYFLLLPEKVIKMTLKQRKNLLKAHQNGKKSIYLEYKSDESYTDAEISKIDNSREYLSFLSSHGTGEGGGYTTNAELAVFKDGANHTLILSSVEKNAWFEYSKIAFFKIDGDQMKQIQFDFPLFTAKDFFDIYKPSDCDGEAYFKNFSCNLSKNMENVLLLKANEADDFGCFGPKVADVKEVELKWTGSASQEMGSETIDCKVKGETEDAGSDYSTEETCSYRNILVKTNSFGDAGGCKFGCMEGSYFLIKNGKAQEVKLEEIFKNQDQLLKKINEGLNANFIKLKKENEEHNSDCFDDFVFQEESYNRLRLSIFDDYFSFSIEEGILSHCYGPIGSEVYVNFGLEEMKSFL